MNPDSRLLSSRFPLTSKYHPEWILQGIGGGANSLWLTEWLGEAMRLKPGMKVLDLGCGKALSSIFLHREYGVQVWATDLWFSASENLQRVTDADAGHGVFPIAADARSLPFCEGFFDAVVSIDSFMYYGTDDLYLNYLARFVKPGGLIGIALAGLVQEMTETIPSHMAEWWANEPLHCLHSATWWKRHWQMSRAVDVEVADTLQDGWRYWLEWLNLVCPDNQAEIDVIKTDAGRHLGYVRAVGKRRENAIVFNPAMSIPAGQYEAKKMLRDGE